MLKRVHIKGYKSLADVAVELESLTVLFGPNAAGKSNFLDALQLLSKLGTSRTIKDAFDSPYRGKPLELTRFRHGARWGATAASGKLCPTIRRDLRSRNAFCGATSMLEIVLFVEDEAHRQIIGPLVTRIAYEYHAAIRLNWRSAVRGHGRMVHELRTYLDDLARQGAPWPDILVVATDANCDKLDDRVRRIDDYSRQAPAPVVLAVPDPHVERWLLLDGSAFKAAVGRGCNAPDQKCDRGRHKQRLIEAIPPPCRTWSTRCRRSSRRRPGCRWSSGWTWRWGTAERTWIRTPWRRSTSCSTTSVPTCG